MTGSAYSYKNAQISIKSSSVLVRGALILKCFTYSSNFLNSVISLDHLNRESAGVGVPLILLGFKGFPTVRYVGSKIKFYIFKNHMKVLKYTLLF